MAQRQSTQAYDRLESKLPLTTFVVDTILDSSTGLDDGLVSLREAVTAANTNAVFGDAPAGDSDGDRIIFSNALLNSTITLSQGELSLIDDVLIQAGDLNVTIDAAENSRHFNVTTSQRVGFGKLTLVNGLDDQGGSISSTGGSTVLIVGSAFENNSADGDGGGAIYNQNGTVHISSESTFTANQATGASGSGGAILTDSGVVAVTGGEFLSNSSNGTGGAIEIIDGQFYATNLTVGQLGAGNVAGQAGAANLGNGGGLHVSGAAEVVITGGSIAYNQAATSGGGLWNSVDSHVFFRSGVAISNNIASGGTTDGGGGVFNDGGDLFIRDATFSDNGVAGENGSGGGIFSAGGRVIVIESTLTQNRSTGNGGGLAVSGGLLALDNATIEGNLAGVSLADNQLGNGGGLHVTGESTIAILADTTFSANVASNEGGGIWNQAGGGMFLSGTTTISNNNSSGDGGGIYNAAYVRSVGTTFVGNESEGQGGGLLIAAAGGIQVQDAIFRGNSSEDNGGGISNLGFLNLTDSTFADNDSTVGVDDDLHRGSRFVGENNVFLPPADPEPPTDPQPPTDPAPSEGVFNGAIADIPVAATGTAEFYYEADTGSVLVSIGASVLIIELRGSAFDFGQFNRDTDLGEPIQANENGLGFLSIGGLPRGVFNLGQILPADSLIVDRAQFTDRFDQLIARTGAAGEPERRPQFFILPGNGSA